MSVKDLALVFGKLRGGLQIMSRDVHEPGTLGMIVAHGGGHYLISAKHVLAKIGDAICQPSGTKDIAVVERVSERLDCAAARLSDDEGVAFEVLQIGRLAGP